MKSRSAILVFFIVDLLIIAGLPAFGQVPVKTDSVQGVEFTEGDSTLLQPDSVSISGNDTILYSANDSIAFADSTSLAQNDSLQKDAKDNAAINSKITYNANDSIIEDVVNRKVYLYGDAVVYYENITLKGEYIVYDFDSYTVHSEGKQDTLGEWTGKPVFTEGNTEFETLEIDYNFKSKKGYIKEVQTKITEGYLSGRKVKTTESGRVTFIKNAEFCPCEDPEAFTRFKISKLKVIKDDQIVSGPGYLAFHGVPTPLVFPFGFFPNVDKQQAGLIIPSYGETSQQGYFLNDGGFYLPIGEYFDTQILGDIYTRGSWGLSNNTRYKRRYKYNGNFNVSYNFLKSGDEDLNTLNESSSFFVTWNHSQDQKANPNSRFTASVNAGSTNRFTNDLNSSQADYLSNTFRSSIQYTNSLANTPWNLSASANHSQNSQTGDFTFTLPNVSLTRARTFPLDGLFNNSPKQQWYEKIGVNYSANIQNELQVQESEIRMNNLSNLLERFENGAQHSASASTSLKLGPVSLNPSLNYRGRLGFRELRMSYNNEEQQLEVDTLRNVNYNDDYNMSAQLTTKLYGMYSFRGEKLQAIRHTVTPNVSFTFTPDFSEQEYGYYGADGSYQSYSPYGVGVYGGPPSGGASGNVNFSIVNNLEAKVATPRDTSSRFSKVTLLENITVRGSYNLFADSLNLSAISVAGRTKVTKFLNLNANAQFTPYANVVGRTAGSSDDYRVVTVDRYLVQDQGKLVDFVNGNLAVNAAGLSNNSFKRGGGQTEEEEVPLEQVESLDADPFQDEDEDEFDMLADPTPGEDLPREKGLKNLFTDFSIPWTIQFGYNLNLRKATFLSSQLEDNSMLFLDAVDNAIPTIMDSLAVTNSIQFSGSFELLKRVDVRFNSGYDFIQKEWTPTTFFMTVDLNCWEFSARVVPFGVRRSYNISLYIKSSLLKDLKFEQNRNLAGDEKFFM